jgi:hypothetical protein
VGAQISGALPACRAVVTVEKNILSRIQYIIEAWPLGGTLIYGQYSILLYYSMLEKEKSPLVMSGDFLLHTIFLV